MIFLWLRQDFVTNKFTCSDLGSAVLFVYLPVLLFAPDNDIVLLRLFLIVHSNGQRVVRVCVCIWGGGGRGVSEVNFRIPWSTKMLAY